MENIMKKTKKQHSGNHTQGRGEGVKARIARWNNENATDIQVAKKKIAHGIREMQDAIKSYSSDIKVKQKEMEQYAKAFWS